MVAAMRQGISHYIEKPFDDADLGLALQAGFALIEGKTDLRARHVEAARQVAGLGTVQRMVLQGMLAGMSNGEIACALSLPALQVQRARAQLVEQLGFGRASSLLAVGCAAKLPPLIAAGGYSVQ